MAYQTTTLADLQAALLDRTDQTPYWVAEESRLAWNEALALWNLLTGRWRTALTLDLVAGQTDYTIPATLLYGARLSSQCQPLYSASIAEFDLTDPAWRTRRTTDGGAVPTRPFFWAPVSLVQLSLYPTPAAALTGGLVLDGVAATPVLVNPTDYLDLADEDRNPLENFVLHSLAYKEGGSRFSATGDAFKDLLVFAAEVNGVLKTSAPYRRMAGLDRRRDLYLTKGVPSRIPQVAAGLPDLTAGSRR
jgi:hypothetical protein